MSAIRTFAPRVTPVQAIRLTPETAEEAAKWVQGLLTSDMKRINAKDGNLVYWVDARARRFEGFTNTLLFMPRRHPSGVMVGDKFFISLPVDEYIPVRDGVWIVAMDNWFIIRSNDAITRDFVEVGEDSNG